MKMLQVSAGEWVAKRETDYVPAYVWADGRQVAEVYGGSRDERGANARLMAAAPALFRALDNLAACFGAGPDTEAFWESWADVTACDCVNPDHVHDAEGVRAHVLREARAALERALTGRVV